MKGKELIAEGRRLARPCTFLREKGPRNRYAAIWRGPGIVPAKKGPYEHWLSVDCRFLPENIGLDTGCLSVYTNEDDCESGIVVIDPNQQLPARTKGIKLYAHAGESLPPLDGVFRLGSKAVQEWLAANDWEPDDGYNDNFPDDKPVNAYQRVYQDEYPIYSGDSHAVLGGWHFPWPDDDWGEFVKRKLVLCTFEDSEPWVEVWKKGKSFQVIQRIT